MSEVASNVVAGIVAILVLFWLFNPKSQAKDVIGAIGGSVIGETQALQGYAAPGTGRSGGRFYGGGQ